MPGPPGSEEKGFITSEKLQRESRRMVNDVEWLVYEIKQTRLGLLYVKRVDASGHDKDL